MDWLTPEALLGPLNEVEAKHAPGPLFAAGDIAVLRHAARVAVVGSRKASQEGLRKARKLASLLAARGVVVVSGLAEGVDTAAHTAALQSHGKTVAVIGTPLDRVYPKQNAELQRLLMREQLVLSQFAPGSGVHRHNFPMRNRTMALISDASVIIEAGNASGSLSQGWETLRLGRPLFIAKSIIDDKSLRWPAEMLRYGALVLSDDTLAELFALLPDRAFAESVGELPF